MFDFSQNKVTVASSVLESTVSAIALAVEQSYIEKQALSQAQFSECVSKICNGANKICPNYGTTEFWPLIARELTVVYNELSFIRSSLESEYCTMNGNRNQSLELDLLCRLNQGCVHLGVALSQLLLPTALDPVLMAETQYKCYYSLVS